MNYFKKRLSSNLLVLLFGDSVVIIISFFLSMLFRFDFNVPSHLYEYFIFYNVFFLVIIKVFCFRLFALYRGMWRYTSIWDMINIIKANVLSTLLLIFSTYFLYGFVGISRSIFVIDLIICTGAICVSRLGIRMFFLYTKYFLNVDNKLENIKNIILVGAGDTGQLILRQILQQTDSHLTVAGIVDDDYKKYGQKLHGVSIVGSVKQLNELQIDYDEIYICVPSATPKEMRAIVEECEKTKKPFKTLPSLSELMKGNISISQLRDVSILDLLGREEVDLDKSLIKNLIKSKIVLITGAGGSIGSELVRQCVKYKPSVLVMLDSSEFNLFKIDRELDSLNSEILIKPFLADIRDQFLMNQLFDEIKPQIVFHAAAYKHVPLQEKFPMEAVKTNIFGTLNLANASVQNNVDKFVLVSTDKAVKPVNVMGATKRIAEIIMQSFNSSYEQTAFMAVRFGNVLGSSGSVIPTFKKQIKDGGPVTVTDPDMERYFMSIPEASQLILQAGSLGKGSEIFILDMGSPIKIIDLASELIKLSGFEPYVDIDIQITGARPGEKKTEELSNSKENLDTTKHDKIFVLDNKNFNNLEISKTVSKTIELEDDFKSMDPKKIRSLISSVLEEYNPMVNIKGIEKIMKTDKIKARA